MSIQGQSKSGQTTIWSSWWWSHQTDIFNNSVNAGTDRNPSTSLGTMDVWLWAVVIMSSSGPLWASQAHCRMSLFVDFVPLTLCKMWMNFILDLNIHKPQKTIILLVPWSTNMVLVCFAKLYPHLLSEPNLFYELWTVNHLDAPSQFLLTSLSQ